MERRDDAISQSAVALSDFPGVGVCHEREAIGSV